MNKLSAIVLVLFAPALCAAVGEFLVAPAQLQSAPYADWAHHHWVWLSSNRANQSSMLQYAQDYLDNDIPVGAVDIDSAWSTGFNNFIFDTTKYPDPAGMVNQFHSQNIRVILWVTSMIDNDTVTGDMLQYAIDNKYVVFNALRQPGLLKWWHGYGCLLDYTNPAAVEWWHSMLDPVLALGIDGWKTDGTDPYIMEYLLPQGFNGTITYREYADLYYGDFFDYTRAKNGDDRLIMSRPVDGIGPILIPFSPRRVVFSGWVGDQDPTFSGLQQALIRYFQSAWNGYVGFGSDIGGYRAGSPTKELFTRWFQMGAFSPLMENGGQNEHRPWMYGNDTLAAYRIFAQAHTELVPYLLSAGSDAYDQGTSIITPLADHNTSSQKIQDLFAPDSWEYLLGPSILVAPVVENVTVVNVTFPNLSGTDVWVSYWNSSETYNGGTSELLDYPLNTFPVFSLAGAIIPLTVQTTYVGHGSKSLADAITFMIPRPFDRCAVTRGTSVSERKRVRQWKRAGLVVSYRVDCSSYLFTATVSAQTDSPALPVVFLLQGVTADGATVSVKQRIAAGTAALSQMNIRETQNLEDMRSGDHGFFLDEENNQMFIAAHEDYLSRGVHLSVDGLIHA